MGKWRAGDEIPKTVNHDLCKLILEAHGWTCEKGGKHVTKMTKPTKRPITIPRHKGGDFGAFLRASILGAADVI